MVNKSIQKAFLVVAIMFATVFSIATPSTEAATLNLSDVVMEKNGKLYTVSLELYLDLKPINHEILKNSQTKYIRSSNNIIYDVYEYLDALAAAGNIPSALGILGKQGTPESITAGSVVVTDKGDVELSDKGSEPGETPGEEVDKEFQVLSIE